jgi:hypothetical protein
MIDPFIFHMPPLIHLPASEKRCPRRSMSGMTDWRKRTQSYNNDPIQSTATVKFCQPCTLNFKPRFGYKSFFFPFFIFAPSSPRHHFFASPMSFSSLHDDKRTNRRTNEQTNEWTVTLPFSRHVLLLLTITNFLPFASFRLLLTLDQLRRRRRR